MLLAKVSAAAAEGETPRVWLALAARRELSLHRLEAAGGKGAATASTSTLAPPSALPLPPTLLPPSAPTPSRSPCAASVRPPYGFVSHAEWSPASAFVSHADADIVPSTAAPHATSLPSALDVNIAPMLPAPATKISEILARRTAERAAAAVAAAAAADAAANEAAAGAPTTAMSDSLPPAKPLKPAARRPKAVKKKGRQATVRFHQTTKAVDSAPNPSPTRKQRRGKAIPRSFDLDARGNTHRVFENANEAVINRVKPDATPPPDNPDKDVWQAEQAALTNAMLAAYGQAGSAAKTRKARQKSSREYVPKARKTQRAKQNRARVDTLNPFAAG